MTDPKDELSKSRLVDVVLTHYRPIRKLNRADFSNWTHDVTKAFAKLKIDLDDPVNIREDLIEAFPGEDISAAKQKLVAALLRARDDAQAQRKYHIFSDLCIQVLEAATRRDFGDHKVEDDGVGDNKKSDRELGMQDEGEYVLVCADEEEDDGAENIDEKQMAPAVDSAETTEATAIQEKITTSDTKQEIPMSSEAQQPDESFDTTITTITEPAAADVIKEKEETKTKTIQLDDQDFSKHSDPTMLDPSIMSHEKQLKLMYIYRYHLQKAFLNKPSDDNIWPPLSDMPTLTKYLAGLESWPNLSITVIRKTKINKVLKLILRLSSIGPDFYQLYNSHESFIDRCQVLYDEWLQLIENSDTQKKRIQVLELEKARRDRQNACWMEQYELEMDLLRRGVWSEPIARVGT